MKKRNLLILIVILILGLIISSGTLYVINLKHKPKDNIQDTTKEITEEKEEKKDYIIKAKFQFSDDYYITLKDNRRIEVYYKTPVYEVCPGTNCMEPTGEYKEETRVVDYPESTKSRIIDVLSSLSSKAGSAEFDADKISKTPTELRILLAVVINSEDMITVDEDVAFEKEVKNTKTKKGTIIHHETAKLSTKDNGVIKAIATDLNTRIKKVFAEETANYDKDGDTFSEAGIKEVNGILKDMDIVYYGPYGMSIVYYNRNIAQGYYTPNDSVKAYYYDYAGGLKEFPAGLKDSYATKAVVKFASSSAYLNYKDDLLPDWEKILKENLYKEGNWNIEEGKVVFYIPAHLLGIIPLQLPVVTIEVELKEDF